MSDYQKSYNVKKHWWYEYWIFSQWGFDRFWIVFWFQSSDTIVNRDCTTSLWIWAYFDLTIMVTSLLSRWQIVFPFSDDKLYIFFFSQHFSPPVISTQHVWPLLHDFVHYHLNKWLDSIQHCQKQRKAFIIFTYMSAPSAPFYLSSFCFRRWGEKIKSNQTKNK